MLHRSLRATLMCVLIALPLSLTAATFTDLTGHPDLRSKAAIIVDSQGREIYSKDADSVRPIASITKLMTAMVIIDSGLDLDEKITVTKADRDLMQLTGSRLDYGATLSRRDMIMLAIMSSENRAAAALGRAYPGGTQQFVSAMNAQARLLGMSQSNFADPAGLNVDNTSTARDLMKLVRAASDYPLIHKASTTTRIEVRPWPDRGPLVYGNTNRLLKNASWTIELSKTGYLNEAGRCLAMLARINGEPVTIVLLDSFGKLTPFGDSNRLRRWMLSGN